MSENENETVQAAQAAFIDLLELAELAAQGDGSEESEALRVEAQTTVLMLIAAIILADGQYDPGEQEFIRRLVDARDKPGGEISYLNDYAARWAQASMEVPGFYRAAVRRDTREGTEIASKMRCRIQLIGNYASVSDGKFVASERETVRRFVALLEDFADAWRLEAQAELGGKAPCGSEEPADLATGPGQGEGTDAGSADVPGPEAVSGPGVGPAPGGAAGGGPGESRGPEGWLSVG